MAVSITGDAIGTSAVASAPVILVAAGTSAAALQTVIDGASAGTRIVLEQGTYRFDQTVSITRDGITLEGQGAVTIIADAALNGAPALQIGAELFREKVAAPLQLDLDAAAGSNTLQMANAATLKPGDVIWIERPNDAALFAEIGDTEWQQNKPLRTGLAIVTSVEGDTVTLDRALPFNFDAETTTVEVTEMVRDVVVRNLTFRGDYGVSDPANFENQVASEDGGMMISVNTSVGTVIENVDIVEPASNGLVMGRSLDAVVDDVTVTGALNKGDDGNGYAFWLRDIYNCTFTNLQAVDTRHAVLFASYTSAVDNTVHVSYTNRDINFHGGLDHGNTVIVDQSIRDEAEQSYLGSASFVNPGTSYGAPTDPDANVITFGYVVATVRADAVVADDRGARIFTMSGNDSVIGGAGNDLVDLGSGSDVVLASSGDDTVFGGQGTDRLVFDLDLGDVVVVWLGGALVVLSELGRTRISGIEQLEFNTGIVAAVATLTTVVEGTEGIDTIDLAASAVAGALVDNVNLTGVDSVVFVGNANANIVQGNTKSSKIFGEAGDDVLYGRGGHDLLHGGSGDDRLLGGDGRDTLDGGAGKDTLRGQGGADVFVASEGLAVVRDFSFAEQDSLRFDGLSTAELVESLSHWLAGSHTDEENFSISQTVRNQNSILTLTSNLGDTLRLANVDALGLLDYLLP